MNVKHLLTNYEALVQSVNHQKLLLSILIISLLVFSPIFTFSEFLTFDDDWYIYENENVINFSWDSIVNIFTKIKSGQYSPFGELYNAILYSVFGKNATAFKICALLVHLLNTTLLFKIFSRLFSNKLFVFFVVLVFAIHPIQVETIAWISAIYRNAVFLMLAGYLFYFKYLESNYKLLKIIPVVICYMLAFLTKEQAILFPVGIVLINLIKDDSFIKKKRFIIELLFWVALTIVFGLVTIEITKHGGPSIVDRNVSFSEKIDLLSKTILSYIRNFLFPQKLSFSYPYPIKATNFSILNTAIVILIIGAGVIISIKNKIVRFGLLWFFGFLSLGLAFAFFHLRDTFMADRYTYLALIGLAVLLYLFLSALKEYVLKESGVLFLLLFFIIFLSILSFNRVNAFKSDKSLWTQAVKANPNNHFAHNLLGYSLANKASCENNDDCEDNTKAIYHFSKAISIHPGYVKAYENRVYMYSKLNKTDSLILDLNILINHSPKNLKFLEARTKAFYDLKAYEQARLDAEKIIDIDPDNAYSNFILGHSYFLSKQYELAIDHFSKALEKNSNAGSFYYFRSLSYFSLKNYENALKDAVSAKKYGANVSEPYLALLISNNK